MVTLLASITGFLGSIVPELLKLLKDSKDKKHELQILELQIKHSRLHDAELIEQIDISRQILEREQLYSTYKSGIKWIDALNSSVRPVLAYSFFGLYIWIKITQYRAFSAIAPALQNLNIIWTLDDQAIFAGIISFYFGQRTFSKIWRCK